MERVGFEKWKIKVWVLVLSELWKWFINETYYLVCTRPSVKSCKFPTNIHQPDNFVSLLKMTSRSFDSFENIHQVTGGIFLSFYTYWKIIGGCERTAVLQSVRRCERLDKEFDYSVKLHTWFTLPKALLVIITNIWGILKWSWSNAYKTFHNL